MNDEVAPIPDLPVLVRERGGSIRSRRLLPEKYRPPATPSGHWNTASRSFLWGTLAIAGFCAHGGGSHHRKAGSRHHTTSRIGRGAKDNPPVVLLGFELQEIWNAFAQAMRDDASTMQATPYAMMGMNKAATLPDKLAERETMLTARIEVVRKLKAAADPLYAALNADQKKTADEIMLGPMGMMM